jgi:hypothetical protein
MAFDESKDKLIKGWRVGDLMFGVYQYGDGEVKFQVGPRILDTKQGEQKVRAGRLTMAEIEGIVKAGPEILKAMKGVKK